MGPLWFTVAPNVFTAYVADHSQEDHATLEEGSKRAQWAKHRALHQTF